MYLKIAKQQHSRSCYVECTLLLRQPHALGGGMQAQLQVQHRQQTKRQPCWQLWEEERCIHQFTGGSAASRGDLVVADIDNQRIRFSPMRASSRSTLGSEGTHLGSYSAPQVWQWTLSWQTIQLGQHPFP